MTGSSSPWAIAGPPEAMPASRADLIETYLKTLFSPYEHKALAPAGIEASTLRSVAEALALNRLGDVALKMYAERARRPGTTADELAGLADLVGSLDAQALTPGTSLDLALDEALPDELRLGAFCMTGQPLDDRAWPIIRRALHSDHLSFAAKKAIARTTNPVEVVLDLLHDESLTEKQRLDLAESPGTLFPNVDERRVFLRRCASNSTLPAKLRDMALAFAARYGDRDAFEALVDRLPTLELHLAGHVVGLFGHFPSRELGERAAEAIRTRATSAKEAAVFAHFAVVGMTSIFETDMFRTHLAPVDSASFARRLGRARGDLVRQERRLSWAPTEQSMS